MSNEHTMDFTTSQQAFNALTSIDWSKKNDIKQSIGIIEKAAHYLHVIIRAGNNPLCLQQFEAFKSKLDNDRRTLFVNKNAYANVNVTKPQNGRSEGIGYHTDLWNKQDPSKHTVVHNIKNTLSNMGNTNAEACRHKQIINTFIKIEKLLYQNQIGVPAITI
jgi:hypothetical protein